MSTTTTYDDKTIRHIMSKNGWRLDRQKGSHRIYVNDKGEHISLSVRCNKILFQKMIKKYKMEV